MAEIKLHASYREQTACVSCVHVIEHIDPWDGGPPEYYCGYHTRRRAEKRSVAAHGLCDEFKPAAPPRRETREGD